MSAGFADDRLSRGRARVEERGTRIVVVVPAKRVWFAMVFWALWAGLVFTFVEGDLLGERQQEDSAVVGTLIGVLFLGIACFLVLAILWMLLGREEAEAGDGRLVLRRILGPLRRERVFDAARVTELRSEPTRSWLSGNFSDFGVIGGGSVAFDYGARTHRFAAALEEAEAKQIARRIEEALR